MDDTRANPSATARPVATDLHELTWGQKGIYEHLRCNDYAMHGTLVGVLWHLPEPSDAKTIQSVLDFLVRRHECLRTVYFDAWGTELDSSVPTRRVRQQVEPPRPAPTRVARCRPEEVEAFGHRLLTRQKAQSVFDPAESAALSAVLIETDAGTVAVAVAISHMAVDGAGVATLEQEFRHCRQLALAGRPLDEGLPPVRHPRQLLTDEAGEVAQRANAGAKQYLDSILRETPRAFLTTGRPRSELAASQAVVTSWTLHAGVARLARAGRVPAQTVLLTLVMALLADRAGERRALFRALYARRHWFRGESYAAPQTLSALVHLEIPAAGTVLDLLRRGRAAAMTGYAQADYDTCALVDLQEERAEAIGAPADGFCMFNCVSGPAETSAAAQARPRPTEVVSHERGNVNMDMQFAFACLWDAEPGAISIDLRQNDRLVGEDAVAFLRRLERFAECAAGDPTAGVDRVLRAAGTATA